MAYVVAQEYIRRQDSDGVTHYIDKQNEEMSCALASIGMMWDMSRQQCGVTDETGYKAISGLFSGSLLQSQLNGDNYGLGNGTVDTNITPTLRASGIRVSVDTGDMDPTASTYGFAWQKDRIRTRYPALILVGWYRGTGSAMTRNGGHFIVAARTTSKGWVVILDPYRGTLHELHGSRGRYINHGLRGWIDHIWYTG
ncbi:MAG: hypothetical protein KF889_15800 [Alphaproteobacteria bacterium]|nr:hypothetical protein [Alphaproteobacteria bacterium]MCW5740166.1 hypothetical protein [Alphaproteobacteria bacterium]